MKTAGTLQSPGGLLAIDAVTAISPAEITDDDARDAGYDRATEVLADLRPDGTLYRIRFHRMGDDPRRARRERDVLDDDERTELGRRLARLSWAVPTLTLISEHPATVSTELAALVGVERLVFKQRVRRLKALGLTESLQVGYRLSPRGVVVLGWLLTES